jgi:hypothetical protein
VAGGRGASGLRISTGARRPALVAQLGGLVLRAALRLAAGAGAGARRGARARAWTCVDAGLPGLAHVRHLRACSEACSGRAGLTYLCCRAKFIMASVSGCSLPCSTPRCLIGSGKLRFRSTLALCGQESRQARGAAVRQGAARALAGLWWLAAGAVQAVRKRLLQCSARTPVGSRLEVEAVRVGGGQQVQAQLLHQRAGARVAPLMVLAQPGRQHQQQLPAQGRRGMSISVSVSIGISSLPACLPARPPARQQVPLHCKRRGGITCRRARPHAGWPCT